MGAQRTVYCPRCQAGRVTKATGRQRLGCASCGSSFLVRDASEQPAAEPALQPAGVAPAPAGIGGVEVLPPARLSIGAVAFPAAPPVPPEPIADASDGATPETGTPPPSAPSSAPGAGPAPAPTLDDPPPVERGPGKRIGYYGRVMGGRR